jgi:hypothetical protein
MQYAPLRYTRYMCTGTVVLQITNKLLSFLVL